MSILGSSRRFSREPPRGLLALARERPELFRDFYEAHREQVLGYFARRVLDPEAAHDLMAETFASIFEGLPGLRGHSDLEAAAYMWTVARHLLWRHRDRGRAEQDAVRRLGIVLPAVSAAELDRAEELADLSRVAGIIREALDQLPEAQIEAVTLRVVGELTYPQIAEMLGVEEHTVRARVSRGLRNLSTHIDHDELIGAS